jgi:dienelactone hydrolase
VKAVIRLLLVIGVVGAIAIVLAPHWKATSLIVRVTDRPEWLARFAQWEADAVSESTETIPIRDGGIRVRIFSPAGTARTTVLLVSGVHPHGIDEARLVRFARDLAGTGMTIVTPEIPDLRNYQVTPKVTDAIEDVALWIVKAQDRFDTPVAIFGISFSGGLAIVAAGRPSLRDRLAYVLSLGGHGNLPRVLRYLCTGIEPSPSGGAGRPRKPSAYALAVLLHQAAGVTVPADQVGLLQQGVETYLSASALDRTDTKLAAQLFDQARTLGAQMPEPSATLMGHVNSHDVAALGSALRPYVEDPWNDISRNDLSLSPDRAPTPNAPVYLLHGTDDNVIPAVEAELLARQLQETTQVRYLLSRFVTHADVGVPSMREASDMIAFWKAVLSEP